MNRFLALTIHALLFGIGAALAWSFLASSLSWTVVLIAAAICTGARAILYRRATGRGGVCLRYLCGTFLIGCYLLWIYLAVAFGSMLSWTLSLRSQAAVAILALAVVATAVLRRSPIRVPLTLPLGVWIVLLLSGWLREDELLRCDDFLALQPPVELVVPANPRMATCKAGEVRPGGRFPRTIWQAPDGRRIVFTTQGSAELGGLDGAVCEAYLGSEEEPTCVGVPSGKSQAIFDLSEEGRLLVLQWGIPIPSGPVGGVVLDLSLRGELTLTAEHWYEDKFGEGFYEPRNRTMYLFSDHMDGVHPIRLPDFERLPRIPIAWFLPGETRYDPAAGEGVACGGQAGAAIRGMPFELRRFSDSSPSWLDKLALSWGCDWDPSTGKVYATVPNLGTLHRIDYDSGRTEKRWWVGFGMRSVAYDRARRRVYFTDFLRGEVLAFDERTEQIVARWFVGRFSRWVRLTPDGNALLATGNLGVVRIPL